MGAAVREQLRQDMSMGPVRACPARCRDRLEHLGTADTADKHAMRIGRQDRVHGIVVRSKYGASGAAAKRGDNRWIADANASIHLEGAKAEIEQDSVAILDTQCATVRTDFRQRRQP